MLKKEVQTLKEIKFLDNEGDLETFEKIINKLAYEEDVNLIKDLCEIFDDEVSSIEGLDLVSDTIFYISDRIGKRKGLLELLRGFKLMFPHAEEWILIINIRILNSEIWTKEYKRAIHELNNSEKKIIVDILEEIKSYESEYIEKFNEIISELLKK
ncbi:Imm30 family immunity protein [Tepidibacter mesophilus]|uniref:Imm30 family immunity protein n=1 Tax=Tepidibacter mesophilus TaxID=655607 RepID=UPI000C08C0C7|nr:Imm30 family immunity protein [Tepidibacter mesophilus]